MTDCETVEFENRSISQLDQERIKGTINIDLILGNYNDGNKNKTIEKSPETISKIELISHKNSLLINAWLERGHSVIKLMNNESFYTPSSLRETDGG
jgi:hypothetical protein